MKIVFVYEQGPLDDGFIAGGIETHILGLGREFTKRGHQVTYLTGSIRGQDRFGVIDGIRVVRFGLPFITSRSWDPANLMLSRQASFLASSPAASSLLERGVDIVHGHIYSSGLAAYTIAKVVGARCVDTVHGSYHGYWSLVEPNRFKRLFYERFERLLAPQLAKMCACQIHTDTAFASRVVEWGAPKGKVKVILNGIDVERFNPMVKPTDRIPRDKPVIMTVRRLVPKNGVEFLVKAAKLVLGRVDARFIIVGDGPQKPRLIALARRLGLSEAVKFIGAISNDRVPAYLAAADIVVVSSIVEASSISLLETMAMAKPTVASGIPGIRDISTHLEDCIHVPPLDPEALAQAILQLLRDDKLGRRLGGNARTKVVSERSWSKVADETLKVYWNP